MTTPGVVFVFIGVIICQWGMLITLAIYADRVRRQLHFLERVSRDMNADLADLAERAQVFRGTE